ncbi:BadF/BadG/BcrA/BcrD ATPase family protein [Clostridium sp.]|uniref:BadF/BadG/BcrA/BcrD ATPase family protein n=1 Tax=Clostridium sp. TaxID=1506 RepID=UPI00261BE915|nr:BadF/BadG/BcrA/BcrD ATPase family protein [Clostridium sp.]
MKKFLVCDGGGTKTDFIVFNEKAEILSCYKSTGTNALFIDEEKAINNVIEGINECIGKAKLSINDLELICLFIPGFERCIQKIKKRINMKNIKCLSDADNAFFGAMGKSHGIVVLSGTGSFAIGISKDNRKLVSGGWGPLIGDKGSGYHIGIMCLEKLAYYYDNNIKDSKLRELFLKKFKIDDEYKIREIIYSSNFGREDVAKISKIVAEAAKENDKDALDILRRAANELVELVITLNKKLNYEKLPVSLIGGVTNIGSLFINIFKEELLVKCENLFYEDPKYDPLIGAMLYVLLIEANIDIEDDKYILSNLSKYRRI